MSQPIPTPTIDSWIYYASTQLAGAGIGTAKLDAEIILAHTIRQGRTYLHAHGDQLLTPRQHEIAEARLDLRRDRTPVSYIIGHKDFYGRQFKVTPSTLIPRPESEAMITLLLKHTQSATGRLIDVGTGSGALGITAKLEQPSLSVTLSDTSRHALKVASANATTLVAEVEIIHSNLLAQYDHIADIILANLPYVDRSWERSLETNFEPSEALFASRGGLSLIEKLLDETTYKLAPTGLVLLEADPRQHDAIQNYAATKHLSLIDKDGFILVLQNSR